MRQVDLYNERLKTIAAANKTTVLDLHAACVEAIVAVRGVDGKRRPAPPYRSALLVYNLIVLILVKLVTGSLDKVRSNGGTCHEGGARFELHTLLYSSVIS